MIFISILCVLLLAVLAVVFIPIYETGSVPEKQRKRFIGIGCAVFALSAGGLYYWLGTPDIVPFMAQREEKLSELKASIVKRSNEVKLEPKNLGAWVELGQDFMETGQYPSAAEAFRQAVVLSHGNPLLIMVYAEALIFSAEGKVTDEAMKNLQMVLLQQPENPEARYYMAVRQLQDGHTQEAMKEMKALYHSLPEGSPLKGMIDKEIGKN